MIKEALAGKSNYFAPMWEEPGVQAAAGLGALEACYEEQYHCQPYIPQLFAPNPSGLRL